MDLPAPGLPPISIAAPGTIPPPKTRSNSLKPLVNLGASWRSISDRVCTLASSYPLHTLINGHYERQMVMPLNALH